MNSPWRDRPIAESLKLFDQMKWGMIEEGKATLRMKQDMQSDNYNLYDLIAYCIKASSHLWTCCSLHSRYYSSFKGFDTFFCSSSLPLIHMQGTSGVSIQVMIIRLHCGFSWKYYTFGMFLALINFLLLVCLFMYFYTLKSNPSKSSF